MTDLTIYYFSGTGNARNVAQWIANVFKNKGKQTEILDIAKLPSRQVGKVNSALIGIIGPTHGFNFPPILLHFIFRFPRSKGQKVFINNTRAGMKMGKFFLPGLSGMTLWIAAIVLIIKGYRIQSLRSVDLPSNWISLHPGLKQKVADSIYEHRKIEVEKYAHKLLKGKGAYKAFRGLLPDLFIAPIAILYYLIGRFVLAKTFYASSACNQCGLCVKQCPVKAIKWVDNRPYWKYTCESCMRCMNACPTRAIETAHGVMGVLLILFYIVFLGLIPYQDFKIWLGNNLPQGLDLMVSALLSGFGFIVVYLLFYHLLHFAIKISWVEKMIVYSSLTKHKAWRRFKLPKAFR